MIDGAEWDLVQNPVEEVGARFSETALSGGRISGDGKSLEEIVDRLSGRGSTAELPRFQREIGIKDWQNQECARAIIEKHEAKMAFYAKLKKDTETTSR